jgi:hypothetical protein
MRVLDLRDVTYKLLRKGGLAGYQLRRHTRPLDLSKFVLQRGKTATVCISKYGQARDAIPVSVDCHIIDGAALVKGQDSGCGAKDKERSHGQCLEEHGKFWERNRILSL